jgi:UDP-GlcNAc:undecaprenyl-phosphate GlcNAc-1-phosphate transferase
MAEPGTERINIPLQVFYSLGLLITVLAYYRFPVDKNNKVFGMYLFFFGLFLSLNLVPIFRLLAIKIKMFDIPGDRKMHKHPTPLFGGIAIFFSFLITIAIFHDRIETPDVFWWIFGTSFLILIIGAIDDYKDLSSILRLIVQFTAAGIVVYQGVRITFLPNNFIGDFFEVALSLLWIVGITNAINFIDGMDGLAAGYVTVCASLLGIVAYQLVMPEYLYILLAIIGACTGFLPFNFRWKKPALLFLGDSGATFLGFIMACLTLVGKWGSRNDVYHSTNEVGVIIPLLVLGVAVFDTSFTIINRIKKGNIKKLSDMITYAGKDHFHHRLHDIGLSDKSSVMIILLITLGLGLGSIALRHARKVDAFMLLGQAFIVFILIGFFMGFVERKFLNSEKNNDTNRK